MAATQMNLRIDSQIKERGDAVLMEAGYSPTQAVRAVWAFAAAHAHEPQVVRDLLQQAEVELDPEREARIEAKRAALRQLDDLRSRLEAVVGPSKGGCGEHLSDKELLREAMVERWEEKGLL